MTLPLKVTLSHRNRISEVAEPQFLSDWFTNGIPEPGTETKATLVDVATGTVLYDEISTDNELLFDNMVIAEGVKRANLTLTASRSGNDAMQSYTHEFAIEHPVTAV